MVGVFLLDLTANAYISQTLKALTLFEVCWGMLKSVVFALLIVWIGCLRGFQTRGGADAVGNSATSAVVSGGMNVAREVRGGMDADAGRLADEIAKRAEAFYKGQGWL